MTSIKVARRIRVTSTNVASIKVALTLRVLIWLVTMFVEWFAANLISQISEFETSVVRNRSFEQNSLLVGSVDFQLPSEVRPQRVGQMDEQRDELSIE